jgi:hypothetical protein
MAKSRERESERSMNKQVCLFYCDKYHISTPRHPRYIVVYFGSCYEGRKLNRRAVEINIFCHREQHCVPSALLVRFRMASYTSLILKNVRPLDFGFDVLGCETMQTYTLLTAFVRNLLPPSSEYKLKLKKT